MEEYFIDLSIADATGNDGLTPATSHNMLNTIVSSDAEKRIWVRRLDIDFTENISFSSGVNTKYIGWPKDGDDFYDSRPQAGIDAGWDDDITESVKLTLADSTKMITGTTVSVSVHNFHFENTNTSGYGLFQKLDNIAFEFRNCSFYVVQFYRNTNSTASYYWQNMKFYNSRIEHLDHMFYSNHSNGAGHFNMPEFYGCEIFSFNRLLYVKYAWNYYQTHIVLENTIITLMADVTELLHCTYRNNNTGNNTGGFNGHIDIVLKGKKISSQVFVSTAYYNFDIKIKFENEYTAGIFYKHGGTWSDKAYGKSKFIIDGFNGGKIFTNDSAPEYLHLEIVNSKIWSRAMWWTDTNKNNKIKITDSSFNYYIIADSTEMVNCKHIGTSSYFICSSIVDAVVVNCDASRSFCTDGYFKAIGGGTLKVIDTSIKSSALVAQSSEGAVSFIKTNPASWVHYQGSVMMTASKVKREESSLSSSLKFSLFKPAVGKHFTIGSGVNSGFDVDVLPSDSAITIYGAIDSATIPDIEGISTITVTELDFNGPIGPMIDSSPWIVEFDEHLSPFKIEIPVSVSFPRRVNVNFTIHDGAIADSVFIDPSFVVN